MNAAPLLSLRGIRKEFGGLTALSDVDLAVAQGEICGVIGPNGAGKSTLFNVVAGALAPTAGSITLAGEDITRLSSHETAWKGVSRAFQLVHLYESMSVAENLLIGAERNRRPGLLQAFTHGFGYRRAAAEAVERAARAAAIVGVEDLLDQRVSNLTYGRQRLVAAARALAAWPKLLLLDEPAAGLSESERDTLAQAVLRARDAGITVLLIEHNVGFVMRLCDHVMVLHFGRRIADGKPAEVRNNSAVVEAYLGH